MLYLPRTRSAPTHVSVRAGVGVAVRCSQGSQSPAAQGGLAGSRAGPETGVLAGAGNAGADAKQTMVEFPSPAEAPTVTAAITVTAGGALFTFSSVDLYSSLTPIPYVFTGIRDSVAVFTATDTQPDTFGDFATVLNPYSSESIDTLVITLANPADVCCPNATGLDNISIVTGD